MLNRWAFLFFGALSLATRTIAQSANSGAVETPTVVAAEQGGDPINRCEYAFETGVLWKLGGGATPLAYTFMPQLLTIKLPPHFRGHFAGGDLVLRPRLSLLIEPIIKGPETHYFGASASGLLEWWNPQRTTTIFFASGGGLGGMNSKGYEIRGGQGQDLNFNWLIYTGARRNWTPHLGTSIGLYFQHISNASLDKVNPGVNALGPMINVLYRF